MFPFGTGHALSRIQQKKNIWRPEFINVKCTLTQYTTHEISFQRKWTVVRGVSQSRQSQHLFYNFFNNANIYFDCDVFIIFVRDAVQRAWLTIGGFFLKGGVCACLMYGRLAAVDACDIAS